MLNLFNLFKKKEPIGEIEFENEKYDINTFFRFPEIIIRNYIYSDKNMSESELRKYSIKQVKTNGKRNLDMIWAGQSGESVTMTLKISMKSIKKLLGVTL